MHLNVLLSLIQWVNQNIRNSKLINSYNQLHKVLNKNAQPNQEKQPFETQRSNLDSALRMVPLNELGFNQIDFLEGCGVLSSIGVNCSRR